MKWYRAVSAALLLAAALGAQTPSPDHARKLEDIHKLMSLTGGDRVANEMFEQMAAQIKASGGPGGTDAERFLLEFRKELDFSKIEEIVSASYDKYLSDEDIKGLVAFYESPAGKHMLAAMPKINSDIMSQIMPLGQQVAQKVMEKLRNQQPEPKKD